MHDPMVVAFEIKRPWPQRSSLRSKRRYWPALVTVWHVEPGGRDAGSVCARSRRSWHVHHWKVQVRPIQKLRRFLFERCAECGRGYPYGYAPIGTWGGDKSWHHECSSLGRLRQQVEEDQAIIRHLVAGLSLARDEDQVATVDWLTKSETVLPFHTRYRLTHMLGYKRDDNYELVAKP